MTDSDSDSVFIFDIQHSTFNHSTVQRQLKSDHRSVLIEHSTFYVMYMFYVYPDITIASQYHSNKQDIHA